MNVVLKIKHITVTLFFFIGATVIFSQISSFKSRPLPPLPNKLFSPSNSKTENNKYIPADEFIKAARCAECHLESHSEWSESLHRNSGREPFYKASVEILERERGTEFAQHCESCHSPTSMFSGALITGSKESRAMDEEGITCSVCHSITDAAPLGTSSFTIRKPYLLLNKNGVGKGAEATKEPLSILF
jgi:hypothetical protein